MRSVLLFTIASSLLAVWPIPTELPHRPSSRVPAVGLLNSQPPGPPPIVTFIDGKTGEAVGGEILASVARGLSKVLNKVFATKKIIYKGSPKPVDEEGRNWLYFKVVGALGCTEGNPCFGWMAKGTMFEPYKSTGIPFNKWYVGVTSGQPAQGRFDDLRRGKPVTRPGRNDGVPEKWQTEWETILAEFEKCFMVPEVTFTPIPISQTNSLSSGDPPETEDTKKELNRALNRHLEDSIIYNPKGRYTKVHELGNQNFRWIYFELTGGDKRCRTGSPCFGCILLPGWGSRYVLIAQQKSGPVAQDEPKLDRVGVYPPGENAILAKEMYEVMETQLVYRLRQTMDAQAGASLLPEGRCKAVVTLIDGKTGEDLGSSPISAPVGPGKQLKEAFGRRCSISYKGLDRPLDKERRSWYFFKVVGVLGCTERDRCFGWIAKGLKPYIRDGKLVGKGAEFTQWYVGISSGEPGPDRFVAIGGKPVIKKGRKDILSLAMQTEWDEISTEFRKYFMIPVVTFAGPIRQTNLPSPGNEDPKKELRLLLNDALHRSPGDLIVYNPRRRYTTVHEHGNQDFEWVYFKLSGGDKRCQTGSPCFGCIVLRREWGTKYVLIAQRIPEPVAQDEAKLDRVGVYPPEEKDMLAKEMYGVMETQLVYRFIAKP
ncbi:hypothetical protein BDP27DRAFT_1317346 [Rhodocollybia butyracea]|uniref:AMMECR1 domain-containing protein n=1 Tax=Rhodocollybia butyracea TaxID=206335 RepID=A0A9P5PX24_9AGAR|nr:hypothetical protein BDP27DRAFT_1317346 [Rhodocollybia butyracea]